MVSNVKNVVLKISLVLVAILMVFSCIPVMAATGDEIAPCAYFAPNPCTFSGMVQNVQVYDGKYMGVEVNATSNIC